MAEKNDLRKKYATLCVCSFATLVTPLLSVLVAKRETYFSSVSESVKIGTGGLICLILIALLVLGKLRVPSAIPTLVIVCALSWLLKTVLNDLFLLSCCALGGKFADWLVFEPRLRRLRRSIEVQEQADASAAKMEDVLSRYIGRT